jgi:hypothetical protein
VSASSYLRLRTTFDLCLFVSRSTASGSPVLDYSLPFPESIIPASISPPPDGSVIVCPPPLSSNPSVSYLPMLGPGSSECRPRRLAREDSFYYPRTSTERRHSRRLTREGAFYHISNSETYPFKAPNGGFYPSPKTKGTTPPANDDPIASGAQSSVSPSTSSPKRKRADAEDVKDLDGPSSEARPKKRRSSLKGSDEGDADDEDSVNRPLKRQLATRRKSSGRR